VARRGMSTAWRGKECGGLYGGGTTGMRIESRVVGRGHWRGGAGGVRCEVVAGVRVASGHGPGAGRPGASSAV
jgi:hypothetical protein